ncbi:restriction endonuclease subunit S [Sulfurimonas sp.]|uniref:restriction endonuclease subunit S n=1 Tax=Sulfurimonas sp. TaxID=2022749 RepID=UPI002B4860FD|nr:restriction endonuclease subunit S [Sulfurimonas sp.]
MTKIKDGYKDSEIGVIPVEWDVVKVGEILNVKTGKMNAQDQVGGGEYPFFTRSVDVQTIDTYAFDAEALFIAGEGNFKVKYYNGKFNCHQRTYMLTSINGNNMKFLLNAIQPKVNKLIATSVGSTVQSLRKPIIEALKIPLPPLKEQEKIANILSTADDKIDAIATQIEKAQTLKKGLLQKLLSDGINHCEFKDSELGKIPESWEIDKLENLTTKIGDGLHGTPKYLKQSDYYFINGNNLNGKSIEIIENTKCISEEEYNKNKKILDDTTVLLSINGTIGSLAYYSNETVMLGKSVAYINSNNRISKQFLFYLLRSSHILDYFMLELTGTTIKNLSLKTIRNTKIPLPPLKEQKQIADILLTADEKLEVLRTKKEKYQTLKKGLLQKLLSGEIRTV